MAAGVLSRTVARGKDVWGHTAIMPFSYVGPNPYATGGEAQAASAFKLGAVECCPAFLGVNSGGTAAVVFQYNITTSKMQCFWQDELTASALVEVTNGTDLSGYTGRGIAYGKG
jgi:hypothetical protein